MGSALFSGGRTSTSMGSTFECCGELGAGIGFDETYSIAEVLNGFFKQLQKSMDPDAHSGAVKRITDEDITKGNYPL